jgi:hypothetical protein
MARPTHHPWLLIAAIISLSATCVLTQPAPEPEQFTDQVATSVALTLTAQPTISSTDTPLPTATEPPTPTETATALPTIPPTSTPVTKPDYACDIINQRPRDDTIFERNEDFDVKWTIVNTGTHTWEEETYLEYQSGPKMTEIRKVLLPRLRPGEEHEVILDAVAPDELDRQIMVWAVYGPGAIGHTTYWMCYPYVRIIVER